MFYRSFIGLIMVWATLCPPLSAQDNFQTAAPQALVIDAQTGTILLEKEAHKAVAPSSMTKIMTVYLVFDALKRGKITLQDTLCVSQKAWKMQGTRMFLPLGARVSVADLLHGVIVQSGNDASVVLAEGLAGDEYTFAQQMTAKALEMGAKNTLFLNASGWPQEGHLSSAYDLALFALRTLQDFPNDYAQYYGKKEFTYNKIKQYNKNPLLWNEQGDGVKTGYTEKGGYGLVGSTKKADQRFVIVLNGLPTQKARKEEALNLMAWAFRHFQTQKLYPANQTIAKAVVRQGQVATVPLVVSHPVAITVRRQDSQKIRSQIVANDPLYAPLQRGQEVGHLVIQYPDLTGQMVEKKIPLLAGTEIIRANVLQRMKDKLWSLLWGTP